MDYWFTSDTHFGNGNIIKYCNRPFASEQEMNATIIERWNKVVKPDDIIYHLGDFAFGREDYHFEAFFRQLKGLIIFVKGNHDRLAWRNRHKFYSASDSYREIEINGQPITLCHYAMRVWNRSHHGAFHLYGHSHGTLPDDPNSLSFDCGVDCHNFSPINFDQVKEIMNKKSFKALDHHGK